VAVLKMSSSPVVCEVDEQLGRPGARPNRSDHDRAA
jgi:hypothetical protein